MDLGSAPVCLTSADEVLISAAAVIQGQGIQYKSESAVWVRKETSSMSDPLKALAISCNTGGLAGIEEHALDWTAAQEPVA